MLRRWLKRLAWSNAIFGAVLVAAYMIWDAVHAYRWREQPDLATGVALVLNPERQVVQYMEDIQLTATLVNRGNRSVVLVAPDEVSESGLRTPIVTWSRMQGRWCRTCGNMYGLKGEELFVLQPGDERSFSEWTRKPILFWPGTYRIAVRYQNVPDQSWIGSPLGESDSEASRATRESTPVSIVSNSVEIVITKGFRRHGEDDTDE